MKKDTIKTTEVTDVIDTTVALAHLVRRDDGYHVIDADGTEGPVCNKRTTDGYIILTPNKANRKCYNEKKAKKFFDEGGTQIDLFYKATRQIGSMSNKLPNEKLISYLAEDLQAEYKAIIDRAIAARDDAKAKPMTELEKAQAKLAKAQAALAKLQAEAAQK